jgi:uncharacterized protein YegP (UPF0339 family)
MEGEHMATTTKKKPGPLLGETFYDAAGEARFRIKGRNGEIISSSEGYSRQTAARRAAIRIVGDPARVKHVAE